jgi:hypothetical protein
MFLLWAETRSARILPKKIADARPSGYTQGIDSGTTRRMLGLSNELLSRVNVALRFFPLGSGSSLDIPIALLL